MEEHFPEIDKSKRNKGKITKTQELPEYKFDRLVKL